MVKQDGRNHAQITRKVQTECTNYYKPLWLERFFKTHLTKKIYIHIIYIIAFLLLLL